MNGINKVLDISILLEENWADPDHTFKANCSSNMDRDVFVVLNNFFEEGNNLEHFLMNESFVTWAF